MSDMESESDGAPEELTFEQGTKKDEEIKELQMENKARVSREKKERRRLWAQRRTKRDPPNERAPNRVVDDGQYAGDIPGMLPKDVVTFLTSREKRVFSSGSEAEEEAVECGAISRKRKLKKSRSSAVLLKDLPPPKCAENSLDFLKKRKAQVPRSRVVLTNANQALRLLATRGNLLSKS